MPRGISPGSRTLAAVSQSRPRMPPINTAPGRENLESRPEITREKFCTIMPIPWKMTRNAID